MTREGERLIELVNELGSRVSHLLTDMVPPAAQVHLLNAQRELITALMLIYEHRVTTAPTGRPRRAATGARKTTQRRRTPARTGKIPIE
ncbi:MAG TPA: hypothetical protein VEQ13_00435 [Methylomirabilota bacterium]|nr:hypothetical protein [Methylomirabilota bacterium]